MLPFSVQLERGIPAHEQILAAVREAMATGQLRDGDPFPSAREITQELRISPSAAQKVVTTLREEGFLAQQQGSGLIVRAESGAAGLSMSAMDPSMMSELPTITNPFEAKRKEAAAAFPFLSASIEDGAMGRIEGYEVRRLIARGGMGMVFEAFDRALMRTVAVKVLAPEIAASEDARARFLREARAAAAVDHENVLPVHAVGETMGFPYLVMPFVNGVSLQARIRRQGALSIDELLRISTMTARGLAAAHERGLVHRDIKPDNILLEAEPGTRVWIADFGLARAAEDPGLTKTGVLAGTPQYSSPEQVDGRELDHRTDCFSFGAVMYAMATGEGPFQGEALIAVLRKIAEHDPTPPREQRPELPEDLEALIMSLLEKEPDKRPADAKTLVERLEAIRV